MTLSDTHLLLLSAAAQRDDKLLVRPDKLGQKAADRLAARLGAAGLVETVAVTAGQPHWASDEADQRTGLRIARPGLEALGIELNAYEPQNPWAPTELPPDAVPDAKTPRGSKRALLLALLRREEGASIAAIMDATGWLAHSTRAALTALRKSRHQLVRSKDEENRTIYCLVDPSTPAGAPTDIAAE